MSEKTDPLKRIQDEINEVARREDEYRRKLRNVNGAKNQDHDDIRSETPLSLSSMNSRESLDDNHSDDSGIISSISPMSDSMISSTPSFVAEKDKYNRPKYYSSVSQLNISSSNNNLSTIIPSPTTPRIFKPINSGQKSIMQKFIASRGKLNLNANNNNSITLNNNSNGTVQLSPKHEYNSFNRAAPAIDIIPALIPAVAERDDEGKPIRRGFVPVEVKIRKELNDLKSRENELKRFRKMTNSTPDLLDAIENEFQESDDEEDEEQLDDEHCLGPQKFKESKLDWDEERSYPTNGLRPALSLAQLCDIDPEDSVSPQSIIAKFERIIQENA